MARFGRARSKDQAASYTGTTKFDHPNVQTARFVRLFAKSLGERTSARGKNGGEYAYGCRWRKNGAHLEQNRLSLKFAEKINHVVKAENVLSGELDRRKKGEGAGVGDIYRICAGGPFYRLATFGGWH